MSIVTINDENLKDIGNAIRTKKGETKKYKPSEMADAILSIKEQEIRLQQKSVTPTTSIQIIKADSSYNGLSSVSVGAVTSAIDSDIKSENIKKGVSILGVNGTLEEGIIPSGKIQISANGTYDVTNFASAVINVANGGGSTSGKYTPRYLTFREFTDVTEFQEEIESIDASKLTSLSNMFRNCSALTTVDISSWDAPNATSMVYMFDGCVALETVNMGGVDLSNVQPIHGLFRYAEKLKTINLRNTNPKNATTMNNLFSGCKSLSEIDLRDWTVSPTNTSNAFSGCSSLRKLDIRGFSFDNVTNKSSMFNNVSNTCEIIVKDAAAKSWMNSNFSSYSNVKTLAEYQAEGGV